MTATAHDDLQAIFSWAVSACRALGAQSELARVQAAAARIRETLSYLDYDVETTTNAFHKVKAERDQARVSITTLQAERDALRDALADLVRLKDGPRDLAYYQQKHAAWERARAALDGKG